jgi:hypothetical protein
MRRACWRRARAYIDTGRGPRKPRRPVIATSFSKGSIGEESIKILLWIVDAHRGDGKRYVARADEKLTAFMELESATRACGGLS